MNRSILALLVIALLGMTASPALAQQPTPAQIEKAKKAFAAGKKAFDTGDFPEAVAKFKESYNLSKNPILLYNIGFANESGGMDDIALFYYRKFLTDAPADAAQRQEVTDRVKALEKKFAVGGAAAEPAKPPKEPPKDIKIKPAGTYSATDFQHQAVDTAPPKKPLDVTAFVPEDSGFVVTLFFRTSGEGQFTSKQMKWRYKELVARIPPQKMLGESIQYYIEVKDLAGAVVTRAGKSTSPNLVTLEAGASPRFYPDFSEDGEVKTDQQTAADDTEEDPLNKTGGKPKVVAQNTQPIDEFDTPPTGARDGFTDVGSSKFKAAKWASTGTAGVLLGLSVVFYINAGQFAGEMEKDLECGAPPCIEFDQHAKDIQDSGKQRQTWSRVAMVVGLGASGIAAYYWYKEMKYGKRTEKMTAKKATSPEASSWSVVPDLGAGDNKFVGATALTRF